MEKEEYKLAEEDFLKMKEVAPGDKGIEDTCNRFLQQIINHKQNVKGLFKSVFTNKIYSDQKLVVKEKEIPFKVNPENPKVYMYIKIGDAVAKRVEIELFKDKVPKTAENFRSLCCGDNNTESFTFHYEGVPFHKIEKNSYIVGGDIENKDGSGGYSIYGRHFEDEHFIYPHCEPGVLSMCNTGKDTNASQFHVMLKAMPEFNEKYIVFGKIIRGMDAIWEINDISTDMNGKPTVDAIIEECGEVVEDNVD